MGTILEVVNPATEEVVGSVRASTLAEVDAAVQAAHAAFPSWSTTAMAERAAFASRIVQGLAERRDELGALITAEMGCPITFATQVQAVMPTLVANAIVDLVQSGYDSTERLGNSLVVREPIGVVGAITPWNYPLHQVVAKVIPALVAGCTVVLKPSELTPLTAEAFADIVRESGLPEGVFHLVHGYGPVVGEAIARHPLVDMVSFTGSVGAGRRISAVGSETIKRVTLELGGKGANIILPDADLSAAAATAVFQGFLNSGQTCLAGTRVLISRDQHDEFVELLKAVVAHYVVGDPADPRTAIGPMVTVSQRDRVLGYIQKGIDEGATLAYGGVEPPPGLDRGYYVQPTIFSNVHNDMIIAREEIFGPVLSVLPYTDVAEAIAIANDSMYGLSGMVFSGDEDRALEVAQQLRVGLVCINGANLSPVAPFGGYRQSGNGRELGRYGLEEFMEIKTIQY